MGSITENYQPDLLTLYGRWRDCSACRLCSYRRRLFEGVGNPKAPVVFVIDRQSPHEIQQMKFFLDTPYEQIIQGIGNFTNRDMSRYWYTPAVACPTAPPPRFDERPPETSPTPKNKEVKACAPRIFSEIQIIEPELLVACGTPAVRTFFPTDTPSLQYYAGEIREAMLPGEHGDYAMSVLLLPSLHALYAQQDMENRNGQWARTFQKLALALDVADRLRTGE